LEGQLHWIKNFRLVVLFFNLGIFPFLLAWFLSDEKSGGVLLLVPSMNGACHSHSSGLFKNYFLFDFLKLEYDVPSIDFFLIFILFGVLWAS
jgi:hypothetical protein